MTLTLPGRIERPKPITHDVARALVAINPASRQPFQPRKPHNMKTLAAIAAVLAICLAYVAADSYQLGTQQRTSTSVDNTATVVVAAATSAPPVQVSLTFQNVGDNPVVLWVGSTEDPLTAGYYLAAKQSLAITPPLLDARQWVARCPSGSTTVYTIREFK